VEVWLAKEGHDGVVGINLLTKVQMPNLATLYGAMLAGVDYVLMGAGIPKEIPGVLDRFAAHEPAQIKFEVEGMGADTAYLTFDPRVHSETPPVAVKRPYFLPIIASNSLATMLTRKATGRVDGFIIEAPTAGGHNAPPRGELVLNERGEPQYGERDEVDLEKSTGFPSGWPAAPGAPRPWPRRWTPAPRGSRWARCSPTPRSRGSTRSSRRTSFARRRKTASTC
jgi:nitronate monooxygenase